MSEKKLRIHTWPDKILRKRCRRVKVVDDNVRDILDQMHALMVIHKGIGIAANQTGVDLSLLVIETPDHCLKLVNPRIIKKEGRSKILEGCLSFPELEIEVKRAKKIWLSALNEKGEPVDMEVEGVMAIIFQHEIDHLSGIVFIDRIPFWKRLKIAGKLKKIKKITKNELSK
ncbi:MAG: peptide deformylase [Candidatus Omnitrophota bacterium]